MHTRLPCLTAFLCSNQSFPSSLKTQMLVEHHGGQVPADMEALEALPGVGHKTAR